MTCNAFIVGENNKKEQNTTVKHEIRKRMNECVGSQLNECT